MRKNNFQIYKIFIAPGFIFTVFSGGLSVLSANGGPVSFRPSTVQGGISPVQDNDVSLLREDLKITVTDDSSYDVDAVYILSNKKPGKTVKFGIPVLSSGESGEGQTGDMKILLNGKSYSCKNSGMQESPNDSLVETVYSGWCVAQLEIPVSDKIQLQLIYTDYIIFNEWESSKSDQKTEYRYIEYLLYPAGYWKGNAKIIKITVDPGPFKGDAVPEESPGKYSEKDGIFYWKLENIDLIKKNRLRINLKNMDSSLPAETP